MLDNNFNSTQTANLTGTSVNGPTPLSVETTGLSCTSGICTHGSAGGQLVEELLLHQPDRRRADRAAVHVDARQRNAPRPDDVLQRPALWLADRDDTFTFGVKVADVNGQTATQAFSRTISPQPPPLTAAQQGCQHAPGSTTAQLTGPAIAGQTPSGQGIGDQSQLTAWGGFTVVRASVKNVNLANRTVLWVTLGGEPIGRITLSGGAGAMAPWTLPFSTLRKQAMGVFTQPPTGTSSPAPLLSGPFV